MDEVMRGVQGGPQKTPVVRLSPLRLWLGVAGTHPVNMTAEFPAILLQVEDGCGQGNRVLYPEHVP